MSQSAMAVTFVDSLSAIASMLDSLVGLPISPPSLYLDLEGVELSRHGTISILQIHVEPQHHTYLIDVQVLREDTFKASASNGNTLKSILESKTIPKVFFDVRNDSDALYSHYGIHLAGVDDLQLMELAMRTFSRDHVNGLVKCIERDAVMTWEDRREWTKVKQQGHHLFDSQHGGSYAVFNQRPLSEAIQSYCVQDVQCLPGLWQVYARGISPRIWEVLRDTARARIHESQSPLYSPNGQHKTRCPWLGWPHTVAPQQASHSRAHTCTLV